MGSPSEVRWRVVIPCVAGQRPIFGGLLGEEEGKKKKKKKKKKKQMDERRGALLGWTPMVSAALPARHLSDGGVFFIANDADASWWLVPVYPHTAFNAFTCAADIRRDACVSFAYRGVAFFLVSGLYRHDPVWFRRLVLPLPSPAYLHIGRRAL